MITCALGCGKSLDETKDQAALGTWEQLTVTATRNGGSETLLAVMVCLSCAPAADGIVLAVAPKPKATAGK